MRFGNVLGSSGSVVPIFRRQIERGGPVTVTDERMTRYFMTIPEAVQLIIRSGSLAARAPSRRQADARRRRARARRTPAPEVFVLDMGEPVRIIELARAMIELSGLDPDRDIDIEIVGARPGEKLHEELFNSYERARPTAAEKILLAEREPLARRGGRVDVRGDRACSCSRATPRGWPRRCPSCRPSAGMPRPARCATSGCAGRLAAAAADRSPRSRAADDACARGACSPRTLPQFMSFSLLALSLSSTFTQIGAIAAFAALLGIAILSLLVFSQAREIKRLREWAGRAPERAADIEQRVTQPRPRRASSSSPGVAAVRPVPRAAADHAPHRPRRGRGRRSAARRPAPCGRRRSPRRALRGRAAAHRRRCRRAAAAAAGRRRAAPPSRSPGAPLRRPRRPQRPRPPAGRGARPARPHRPPVVRPEPAAPVVRRRARASAGARRAAAEPRRRALAAAPPPPARRRRRRPRRASAPPRQPRSGRGDAAARRRRRPTRLAADAARRAAGGCQSVRRPAAPPASRRRRPAGPRRRRRSGSTAASATRGRARAARRTAAADGPRADDRRGRARARLIVVVLAVVVLGGSSGGKGAPARTTTSTADSEHGRVEAPRASTTRPNRSRRRRPPAPAETDRRGAQRHRNDRSRAPHLGELQQSGYSQATALDGQPAGRQPVTVVQYASGHQADAEGVARSLSVRARAADGSGCRPLAGSAKVVVIVGADKPPRQVP